MNVGGNLQEQKFAVTNSSLASQAVGPPISRDEMSFLDRSFPDIGKKIVLRRPLDDQLVHPQDSVLGPFTKTMVDLQGKVVGLKGLGTIYMHMIMKAFHPKYWDSRTLITFNADGIRNIGGVPSGLNELKESSLPNSQFKAFSLPQIKDVFTQLEANFALFFGLAVQRYQQTLVSDDAPLDRFMAGNDTALTPRQLQGLLVFLNQKLMPDGNNNAVAVAIAAFETANPGIIIGAGNCISCHGGAELTIASVRNVSNEAIEVENTRDWTAVYSNWIPGERPCWTRASPTSASGVPPKTWAGAVKRAKARSPATTAPFPLSFTRQAQLGLPFPNAVPPNPLPSPEAGRSQVDGAFKIPGLRNVELTGPYFHNGGQATLAQVIEFYDRQSDFGDKNIADIYINLVSVNLEDQDEEPLIDFLIALTDDRVRKKLAPFDHPQLFVPNGHPGDQNAITCLDAAVPVISALAKLVTICWRFLPSALAGCPRRDCHLSNRS